MLLGPILSKDDSIERFFNGVYRLRPPLPNYNATWDTNAVLDHLNTLWPNEELSLDKLTKRTITLIAITIAHRIQTLSKIDIKNIEFFNDHIVIKTPDFLKTSRRGSKQPIIVLPFFLENSAISPAKTSDCHLNRTILLRNSDNLLVVSVDLTKR